MRISSLPGMAECPGRWLLRLKEQRDFEAKFGEDAYRVGGTASQNGSAVGRVVELWHRLGESPAAIGEALQQAERECSQKYPRAEWEQVEKWARGYAQDPRNRGTVWVDQQEREISCTIPCAPEDPTGLPIKLVGHDDQIRIHPKTGGERVWDLKAGGKGGRELVYNYAWQLAGYAVAATETYGRPILPGGIVRLRGYTPRAKRQPGTHDVFFSADWSLDACREMLATVAQHVAWLRMGLVHMHPGAYCQWCPGVDPGSCGLKIQNVLDSSPALV